MMRRQQQDQQSRVFYELSALVLNILRSPPSPIPFSENATAAEVTTSSSLRRSSPPAQISPAGFASLLLGISLTLMLCGSVTFFIGFILMPWVLGLVMVFYVAGIVSTLSMLGRSLFCYAMAPPTPRKDIPGDSVLCYLWCLPGTRERDSSFLQIGKLSEFVDFFQFLYFWDQVVYEIMSN